MRNEFSNDTWFICQALLSPLFTLTILLHIEFPFDANVFETEENKDNEVGQASGRGPEATCMHPEDNNPPDSPRAVYSRANGGAGTVERAQGGWVIFQPQTEPQRQP